MKKLAKLAALLAAAALLFGAAGCSGDDDDDPPAKTLEGIKITADDTVKTQYDVGAELDLRTGVKVTAEYSDKSEENVTGKADITATYKDRDEVKPFTTEAKGIFKVTLAAAYEGKEAALKEPITINVGVELVSISMEVVGNVKVTYKQGEPIDPTGIKVTAHYDNESESVLSNSEVEFTATYKDGDEDKPFDTSLEPGKYDNVTLIATYKGKTAKLPATTITIVENDGGEDSGDDDDDGEETYFKSFVASDLSGDIKSEISDDDKTWVITPKSNKTLQKKSVNVTTYDGKTYTARLAANNSQGEGIIKLKIGAGQTKILRVDAGTSQGSITDANPNSLEDGTIKVGGTTWAVHLAASTNYFEVTGGDDGYVAIDLTGEKANIYAITVVDALVDTSKIDRTAEKITYNAPVISLAEGADTNSPLTAEVAKPTKTTTTYTAKADGVAAATTADKNEELTDITLKYSWSKGSEAISEATGLTYTPTTGGVYTFTASYTAEDGKTYSASKSVTVMSNTTYTVTFNAGDGGSFTNEGEGTTKFTVHEGLTLKEEYPDFKEPTPTAPEGNVFTGWKSSAEEITIESPIKQDVTFTAQYGEKPTTTTYTVTAADFTDGVAKIDGMTFTLVGQTEIATQRGQTAINTKGGVSKTDKNISFILEKAGTVTVWFFNHNGSADGRYAIIMNSDGEKKEGEEKTASFTGNLSSLTDELGVKKTVFDNLKADTYYLGSNNGVYITQIEVTVEN